VKFEEDPSAKTVDIKSSKMQVDEENKNPNEILKTK